MRPKGSKNRPKTEEELIAELVSKGYGVDGKTILIPKPSKAENPPDSEPKPPEYERIELEVEDENEDDTPDGTGFKCGACGKSLDGEVSPCPHCGANLTWQ